MPVNSTTETVAASSTNDNVGRGPAIWLAGDPADLKQWMKCGVAGIVTNTVVLNEMVKKYGQLTDVIRRYLDITELPIVVEVDGHSTDELLDTAAVFTKMSDQIMIKLPCTAQALGAFVELHNQNIETMCTTVFSLVQACAVARAGATHILPFCEPVKEMGGDPTKLVRECRTTFASWSERPMITAALVRSVDVAYRALRDGADGIIIFWPIFAEMMLHPLTAQWNETFKTEWEQMHEAGLLKGIPVLT